MLFLAGSFSNYLYISTSCGYMQGWHRLCCELSRDVNSVSSEAKDVAFSFSREDGHGDLRLVSRMQKTL
jgi:hypothetical protein